MKTKKEVAKLLGMKPSSFNSLLNGTRGIGKAKALEMERRTGIYRTLWLYPDNLLFPALENWCGDKINKRGRGRIG